MSATNRRSWVWRVAAALAFLVVGAMVLVRFLPSTTAQRLRELKALGYPVSLDEVEGMVPRVAESENLFTVVREASDSVRVPGSSGLPLMGNSGPALVRGEPWEPPALEETRALVSNNAAVFGRIPEMLRRRQGYDPLPYTNGYKLLLPHLGSFKKLSQALALKAGLDAEEGRPREAVDSLCAGLAVARSLDGEPILISQLVRFAAQAITASATERLLKRVTPADADMARLEQEFLERGEVDELHRSMAVELCSALEIFTSPATQLPFVLNTAGVVGGSAAGVPAPQRIAFTLYGASGLLAADRDAYVDLMARYIQILRRPSWERLDPLQSWEAELTRGTQFPLRGRILTRMLLPAVSRASAKEILQLAQMRCAATALAIERYRLAHGGQLPNGLPELVPGLLPGLPLDPYDGKPLRFRVLAQGYVVYALGPDRDDDHGRERVKGQTTEDWDATFVVEK